MERERLVKEDFILVDINGILVQVPRRYHSGYLFIERHSKGNDYIKYTKAHPLDREIHESVKTIMKVPEWVEIPDGYDYLSTITKFGIPVHKK